MTDKNELIQKTVEEFNKAEEEKDLAIAKGEDVGLWTKKGIRLACHKDENGKEYCLCKTDELGDGIEIGFAVFNDGDDYDWGTESYIHRDYAKFTPYCKKGDKIKLYNERNCVHAVTIPISFEEISYTTKGIVNRTVGEEGFDEDADLPDDAILIEKERVYHDVMDKWTFEEVFNNVLGSWYRYTHFSNECGENLTPKLISIINSTVGKDFPQLLHKNLEAILEKIDGCNAYKSEYEGLNKMNEIRIKENYLVLSNLLLNAKNVNFDSLNKHIQKIYRFLFEECRGGGIRGEVGELRKKTGVFPDNETVQEAYKTLFSKGEAECADWLKQFTNIEPNLNEMFDSVQEGYKILFQKGNLWSAKDLMESTSINPSKEAVEELRKTISNELASHDGVSRNAGIHYYMNQAEKYLGIPLENCLD